MKARVNKSYLVQVSVDPAVTTPRKPEYAANVPPLSKKSSARTLQALGPATGLQSSCAGLSLTRVGRSG